MTTHITNSRGEVQVDPYANKAKYEKWMASVTGKDGDIDYYSFKRIDPESSFLLTQYILDMSQGKNTARGSKRGPRGYMNLNAVRTRLNIHFRVMEEIIGKKVSKFTEDDVMKYFNGMRDGTILNMNGTRYLSVQTYVKKFSAFWRWYMKYSKKKGEAIMDIVCELDTSAHEKPKWDHFTLKDVEKMANVAPNIYYRTLVYFLFDSGIRSPTELMNVRAMDITTMPSGILQLNIRDETSKTFGRKIKLMISSSHVKKYLEHKGFQPGDFLFHSPYAVMTRMIARIGNKALGIGTTHKQAKTNKIMVKGGISMYDFRHNSVCHYLPIYKSENQMKYRYGWKKADMIHYYSEFIGMKDTITEDDLLVDTTKTELQQKLEAEQKRREILEEQLASKEAEMEERMKKLEAMMLQKFADGYKADPVQES